MLAVRTSFVQNLLFSILMSVIGSVSVELLLQLLSSALCTHTRCCMPHDDTLQMSKMIVDLSGNAVPLWRLLQHKHAADLIAKLSLTDSTTSVNHFKVPLAPFILGLPHTEAMKATNWVVTHMPASVTAVCSYSVKCPLRLQ
jgi:hypothetical protein